MYQSGQWKQKLKDGVLDGAFTLLYGSDPKELERQRERYCEALDAFGRLYGEEREIRLFSVPGRTEVGGNHTDHQRGCVLAAGVNLDLIAVVAKNSDGVIRIQSAGFPEDVVRLEERHIVEKEKNTAASLIRGVAARFGELGLETGGFDAYTTSQVLTGSGLSSSAAFEVMVGTILSGLYNDGKVSPVEIAKIAQYAENVYFGKPCGLMDQTACAVGGFVYIDFEDAKAPEVKKVEYDFARSGYSLCIVDSKADHADLTQDYAAIPAEMKQVAAYFGKEVLREVPEQTFFDHLGECYSALSHRAVSRAIHFYNENARVQREAQALEKGDFDAFCRLVIASGYSSQAYLQNVFSPAHPEQQALTVALALSDRILSGQGAWRVHGGGFAGTIQAFVPSGLLEEYRQQMEAVYGQGSCHVLRIRPVGLCEVSESLAR